MVRTYGARFQTRHQVLLYRGGEWAKGLVGGLGPFSWAACGLLPLPTILECLIGTLKHSRGCRCGGRETFIPPAPTSPSYFLLCVCPLLGSVIRGRFLLGKSLSVLSYVLWSAVQPTQFWY